PHEHRIGHRRRRADGTGGSGCRSRRCSVGRLSTPRAPRGTHRARPFNHPRHRRIEAPMPPDEGPPMSRYATLALLLLATASAPALADECAHSAPRNLDLDFAGVKSVLFEIGPHKLRVEAVPAASGKVAGRACASDPGHLERLTLAQERSGDKLVVRLQRDDGWSGLSFGKRYRYAYLELDANVPDNVLVQLDVGSGDAWATGAAALSADVGSGDVDLRRTRGRVTAKVGSGDVRVDDAGSLHVLSIGSGDVEAANVRGDADVGSIGSGDFRLRRADGSVKIGSIGSGDAELSDIGGSVHVGSIGSGDLDINGVDGDLVVASVGSGDIDHGGVRGKVDVPRKR